MGWKKGLEPSTFGTTIRRSNQLSYIHHVDTHSSYRSANVIHFFGLCKKIARKIFFPASGDKMAVHPARLSRPACQNPLGTAIVGMEVRLRTNPGRTDEFRVTNNKTKTAMNVKPLSDRVLILPNPAEEKTAGGLIIPDTAKEKPLAGKVVAVGPGTSEVKMEVKVGDQVLYGKYAGQEIQIDGETYLIMKQNDILAII